EVVVFARDLGIAAPMVAVLDRLTDQRRELARGEGFELAGLLVPVARGAVGLPQRRGRQRFLVDGLGGHRNLKLLDIESGDAILVEEGGGRHMAAPILPDAYVRLPAWLLVLQQPGFDGAPATADVLAEAQLRDASRSGGSADPALRHMQAGGS